MSDRSLPTLHPETSTRIRISGMAEELTSKDAAAAEYDCAFAIRHGVLLPFVLRAAHLAPGQHVLDLDIATGTGRCEAQRPVGGGFLG